MSDSKTQQTCGFETSTGFYEPVFIPELGYLYEVPDVGYHKGLTEAKKRNIDFTKMTARNTAHIRLSLPPQHPANKKGNWIFAEIAYHVPDFPHPILILGDGPVFHTSLEVDMAYTAGTDFFCSGSWTSALSALAKKENEMVKKGMNRLDAKTFPLPTSANMWIPVETMMNVETNRLGDEVYVRTLPIELQIAAFLFQDLTSSYAKDVLFPALILKMLIMLQNRAHKKEPPDMPKKTYAEPLWLGSITPGCGSCLVGCLCGNWMRGIQGDERTT